MLITDAVHIWRESDGDYHIEWRASHADTKVTVEALTGGGSVAAHYHEAPLPRASFSGLEPASRHYFRLSDQHGTEVLATERNSGTAVKFPKWPTIAALSGRPTQTPTV